MYICRVLSYFIASRLESHVGPRDTAVSLSHLFLFLSHFGAVSEDPEPQDRYHGIYFAMLLAGVGFLLPYNSFITDVDYLHHKYPGRSGAAPALP